MEECFLTLLAELRDALASMNCPHHWFSFINLFDIEAKELQHLAKKVERIMKDPAPFLFDDVCGYLRVVYAYHTTTSSARSSEQFLEDYADGCIIADPGKHQYQLPVSSSPISEDHLPSSGIHSQGTTLGPEQRVLLPPSPIHISKQ